MNTMGHATASIALRARLSDYVELTKPGITTMVVLTAAVGYWIGLRDAIDPWLLFHVLVGTGLASGGACTLNMLVERKGDARMARTRSRPLPAGRVQPWEALLLGVGLAAAGVTWLALGAGAVCGLLAAMIVIGYLFAYTPLKPVSAVSTLIGAQMGAAPPLIGWYAARGDLGLGAWALFAIIVFWQWPHILSMAWMNRHDFIEVDYPFAPVFEGSGNRAARQMIAGLTLQLAVSTAPFALGLAGWIYLVPALALGLGWLWLGVGFARERSTARARRVFLASLLYLPLLLAFLVVGKTG